MVLIDELQKNDKKGLFTSNDNYVNYLTGITPLDYAMGFWQKVTQPDNSFKFVPILGVIGGTLITLIGATQSGKTTFAEQLAYNIIRRFESGLMAHIDAEKTALKQRLIQLAGAQTTEKRIILVKDHTSIEDVQDMFGQVCEMKETHKKELQYEVIDKSFSGEPFMAYVPTVFIIDSLPSFNSKENDVDSLGTNMDGARGAKDVSRFFSNILDRMWKYNITFIVTNHIRPKIDTSGGFSGQPPRQVMMLNQKTEQLPRGSVCQFYSHTFIRINSNRGDMYDPAEYGFRGVKSTFMLAKSKTNFLGTSFPVCFNEKIGFDPIFTLFENAKDMGLLMGRNPYLYLEGMEDMKFSRKDFRDKYIRDEEFRVRFTTTMIPYFESMLGAKESTVEERELSMQYGEIMDDIIIA